MSNIKSRVCPVCGGKLVPIVYGEPMGELMEMAERGEIVIGGCCIEVDEKGRSLMPEWACTNCVYTK